jgi:predicted Zn-dependent peptidase
MMLKPLELKNGLTVLRLPKNSSQTFSINFMIPGGSSIEEGYFPLGISHLVEKLFWSGTDKHTTKQKLNLVLESMGGNFNSFTSKEMTGLSITVPYYHQSLAVSFLAEIIQHSYFESRDIDREKKTIINNIKENSQNVDHEADEIALANLYLHSSLGLPVQGSVDTISNISQGDILEYLSHQLKPDKCYLVLNGNFDNKPLMETVEQEWSVWSPKTKNFIEPIPFQNEDVGNLPRTVYRQRGIAQTYLYVNFLLDEGLKPLEIQSLENEKKEIEPDYTSILDHYLTRQARLFVLNAVLGQGLSSRLWTKSVEEEMLFNAIRSDITKYRTTGYLQIFGEIENTQFSFGLESILSVLEGLKKTTIPMTELAKAKEFVKGRMILDHEDSQLAMLWKVENLLGSSLNYELEDLLKKIDLVTINDIRDTAVELFTPQKLLISTYGPAKETRLVDKLIRKYLL